MWFCVKLFSTCLFSFVWIATASQLAAGAAITQIGDPLFSVQDVSLFSWTVAGDDGEDLFLSIEAALKPHYSFYNSPTTPPVFAPAIAIQPPYDRVLSNNATELGMVLGDLFTPQQLRIPNGIMLFHTIVPTEDAPLGKSFDFDSGPVLPLDIYPLTETIEIRLNNGVVLSDGPLNIQPLQDLGIATDVRGNTVDFTGLLESHVPVVYKPLVAPPFVPDADLFGDYEWNFSVRDAHGNGWDVSVPFKVTPEPSANGYLLASIVIGINWFRRRLQSRLS